MAEKQKSELLSIEQKYEILQMIDEGQTRKFIAEKYNISSSTVAYIYSRRKDIKEYFESRPVIMSRFTIRLPLSRSPNLDRVLYQWFIRCVKNKIEMTGIEIQKKALEINQKLKGNPDFKASGNWLQNFRERNDISYTYMQDNFPTPTKIAADTFKVHFNKLLKDGGFTLENVYNACYTAILWKAVPEGTLIFRGARSTASQKMCEDHVTTLFCANATGCHKLPVLLIGRIVGTQSSYNLNTNTISTIYAANTNAWMDSTIFNQWFEKHFLKSVKERQEKNGRREKTLLLLDNARLLPDLKDLNEKDEFVTVMSPPLNVTPLRQPMNSGIIASFKRKYRKVLVQTLASLHLWNTEDEVIDIYEKLNMWDCCRIVHDAWSCVEEVIMKCSWGSILNPEYTRTVDYSIKIRNDVTETVELMHGLPGCKRCATTVSNWFVIDNIHDIVTKMYTDEVLRDFENKTLGEEDKPCDDDEAGPSRPKIPKLS